LCLDEYQKAQKKDIKDLLWDKLPNVLDDQKKEYKVSTLLASLKKSELIVTDSENRQKSYWVLTEKGKNSLKI